VSITGGIQPGTLQRALGREYFENGLAARLLLACPPRLAKTWTETEVTAETEAGYANVLDALFGLQPVSDDDGEPQPGIVRLSGEAKSVWVAFYNEHAREHVSLSGDEAALWSKVEGYAARLSLVIHLVRWGSGDQVSPDVVDVESIEAGIALARWFGQETRRVYSLLSESEEQRHQRELVELVQRHGGQITVRDLMRGSRAYATAEAAERALDCLVDTGAGSWTDTEQGAKGGRTTRVFTLTAGADADTTQTDAVYAGESGVVSAAVVNSGGVTNERG
jgi:hypothetical protein